MHTDVRIKVISRNQAHAGQGWRASGLKIWRPVNISRIVIIGSMQIFNHSTVIKQPLCIYCIQSDYQQTLEEVFKKQCVTHAYQHT